MLHEIQSLILNKNRNKFTTEILKTQWHFNSPCFRLWSFTSLTLGSGRLRLFTFFYYLRFNIIVCYLIWYKGTTTAPKCLKMAKNSSCMKNEAFYFKTLKPPLSRCGNLDT